jgi:hypothetical protein
MNLVMNYVIMIVMIWIVGYGMLWIVGQHGWYVGATKRMLKKLWSTNSSKVIWMVVGFALALAFLTK